MENSSEDPLIPRRGEDVESDDDSRESLDAPAAPTNPGQDGDIGAFLWLLVLSAGISGLLFGYDTGVISATLVSLGTSLSGRELTSFDKSIVTSCTSLFALVAAPLSSVLADAVGRKPVILLADILFILGAIVQAGSYTISSMVLGRSIVGIGIGAASFVTPLYIAELAPAAHRGRLVTMNNLAVTFGQVIAYVIGWLLTENGDPQTGWRWLVGIGAFPALLQCLLILFMPETPRWLVKAGRTTVARHVIHKISISGGQGNQHTNLILADIQAEIREEEHSRRQILNAGKAKREWLTTLQSLATVPKHRRALTIACLLQGLQQLCGFNSLMYFSATIFTLLGFSIPTLTSLSVATTNFLFTLVSLALIDRIGRRRTLLYSIPFMIVGLVLAGASFGSMKLPPASAVSTTHSGAKAQSESDAAVIVLASIILYVASYAIGLGVVPWMQSELFPLSVRSLGSGIATATNWSANFLVGLTFLPMMDAMTPTWTFALYAVVCSLGWVVIWFIYPETSGLTLEEATGLLEHGWGVK